MPIVDKKCALDRLGRSNRAQPLRERGTKNDGRWCDLLYLDLLWLGPPVAQTSCGSDLQWLGLWLRLPGSGPPVARTSCVQTSCGSDLPCPDLLWLGHTVSGPTVAQTSCVWISCGSDLLSQDLLWLGPPVARTSCGSDLLCPGLLWLRPTVARTSGGLDLQEDHRRSEGVTDTGGPRETLSQEVRGSQSHRRSERARMMEAAGSQKVHRVHSRSARRPDVSGSHSRSISDQIRSSWFLPCLEYFSAGRSKITGNTLIQFCSRKSCRNS